jgi:hypothetical protein
VVIGGVEATKSGRRLMLQVHSLTAPVQREAGGFPTPVRRHQVIAGRRRELPPLCAICDGYNLHAGVHLGARARPALERLCKYTLRGPLPKGRLEERPDGRLLLRLKRPWSDGRTALIFEPLELLARLAALLPRPGKNGISYHGVLGASAALRAEVVPTPPQTDGLPPLRKTHDRSHAGVAAGLPAGAIQPAQARGEVRSRTTERPARRQLTPDHPATAARTRGEGWVRAETACRSALVVIGSALAAAGARIGTHLDDRRLLRGPALLCAGGVRRRQPLRSASRGPARGGGAAGA